MQALNRKKIDFTEKNRFMFFGEQPNIARYDVQKHYIFEKLIEKHLSFFWRPDEIDCTKDSLDFKELADHEKHIFIENICYQTILDSTQSRSINLTLLPFVSLPELETLIETWAFSETIHSRSYTHILRNIINDPSEVFDSIITNDNIMKRTNAITGYYDDFIQYALKYDMLGYGEHTINGDVININEETLKEKLLLCIASINILEGIRFYVSFACSFAFAENGRMEGNAKIIKLIARDENLHLAITQNILKKWSTGQDDPLMKTLFEKNKDKISEMYEECVEQEKEWARYLFKDGSILGLNERILCEYVEYITGQRMRAIGIKHDYSNKNPLTWTEKYLKTSNNQVAPQETEIVSYTIGGIKQDISTNDFSEFM